MDVIVREVNVEDAPRIAELSSQLGYARSVPATSRTIESIIRHPDEIIRVAVHQQMVVGWIHVFYATRVESSPFCEIGGIVIDDHYRHKGIGKLLVASIKPWCMTKGTSMLRVRCNIKRNEAHQFYLTLGFEEVKQQTVFEINMER